MDNMYNYLQAHEREFNKKITVRSVYGKVKDYYFQPLKQPNGMNLPFVKKVRTNVDGQTEMILSERELNDPNSIYFIPEDQDIIVTDGTEFDLRNPLDRHKWLSIKDSELIVPMRGQRDEHGNLIIDGDKKRYGLAELWIDVPGEESERSVSRKKLITKAWTFIENDSVEGRLTKIKFLGKSMWNAPDSDVADYLYQTAEKKPELIINIYTDPDMGLRLMLINAKEKNIVRKINGLYMYGDIHLGANDDAVILSFKDPTKKDIITLLRNEVYPGYLQKIEEEVTVSKTAAVKEPKGKK